MKDGVAMKINRTAYDAGRSNWVSGETDDGYAFEAQVFAEPSMWGIPTARFEEGGNVSRLRVVDPDGREAYAYDRGLDGESGDEALAAALEIIATLEAAFCEEA